MSKALIVDDSRATRMILKQMLDQLGYGILEAGNGKEAFTILQKEGTAISVVLVDWNMPEMNGYEFVVIVRADKTYDAVRLMMVTSETDMSHVASALQAGANEYVMKPFTKEMIQEKLAFMGVAHL